MNSRLIIVLIYMLALSLLMVPSHAKSFQDFDVDFPSSSSKDHTLRITIDGCDTLVKIKSKDLESFSKDSKSLKEAIEIATKRSKNGCK